MTPPPPDRGVTLITGGAGFIGTNVAARLLTQGHRVRVLDNLSRPGVAGNLSWLQGTFGSRLDVAIADIRDATAVSRAVAGTTRVVHLAAQVAVTTSLVDPVLDFDVNVRGTLHLLEAIRAQPQPATLLFTSTNKVYGALDDLALGGDARYEPTDAVVRAHGVDESRPLDFHSPYGCSKGAADQYVLDYARTYGLRAVVFRMSCIYGPHQVGTEDQGWVAHFMRRALAGQPIVIYGDGKQVRDVLFVDDLVDAMLAAEAHLDTTRGRAFNIGGGPAQTTSLLELLALVGRLHGRAPAVSFDGWRTGDQRYYVSDVGKFHACTGWTPAIGVVEGMRRFYTWLRRAYAAPAAGVAPAFAASPAARV